MKQRAMKTSFRKGVFDETGGWPTSSMFARPVGWCHRTSSPRRTSRARPTRLIRWSRSLWSRRLAVRRGRGGWQNRCAGRCIFHRLLDNGKYNGSYKIPYEAIVPRKGECDNLIVPVCVSASHIAFTSLRMEPVWMVLGESAGVAAAMAVDARFPCRMFPTSNLRRSWTTWTRPLIGSARSRIRRSRQVGKLEVAGRME